MEIVESSSINPANVGQTLAAAIRQLQTGMSWADARRLISSRRVRVNGNVCLDDARRLNAGDQMEVLGEAQITAAPQWQVRIVFSDGDIVVVEKPAGLQTVRRNEERNWDEDRKRRQPVLAEIVEEMLWPGRNKSKGKQAARGGNSPLVRPVHRLDRDTSGLMLFALSAAAEGELVRRFAKHDIRRVYRAVVHGTFTRPRTIESWIVRDRSDGVRGSVSADVRTKDARRAVTHVQPIEAIGERYSIIECRLETGRTHQIRIHLAEIGHMLCGEKIYLRPGPDRPTVNDTSAAPRQALHSAGLEFNHPISGEPMRFESDWPKDLRAWLAQLRRQCADAPHPPAAGGSGSL